MVSQIADGEIQRSLGRIEGTQTQIIDRLERLEKISQDQDARMAAADLTNQRLQQQDDNARTIGKYIIGILGSLFMLVGSAVIAAVSGHLTFNIHK